MKKQYTLAQSADFVMHFITENYYDRALWAKFVDQFRLQDDTENNGWKGEYWGKSMRGAAMVYRHNQDPKLYDILTETVRDLLTTQEASGRISSYKAEKEFFAWDVWCRKYVMLGSIYYLEICKDEELKQQIIGTLCRHLDYIIDHIGKEEGKVEIIQTSVPHYALNSSSILEPVVKLYRLTGVQKYLDFATYIVQTGGARGINIFQLAYENKLLPHQYGAPKCYELMSCFEGLMEYYYVTGIEKYRQAAINFCYALLKAEVSVIGCCGMATEYLDYTAARQTVPYEKAGQETCVTVTFMKLCAKAYGFTGDPIFLDQLETSFYNAYMGSLNEEHKHSKALLKTIDMSTIKASFLPFDSYAPLLPGARGTTAGGAQQFRDGTYYGCCACIGGAGVATFLDHVWKDACGSLTINQYINGTYGTDALRVTVTTQYPADGKISLQVCAQNKDHTLKLRIPGWCKNYKLESPVPYSAQDNYLVFHGNWSAEQTLTLDLDMPVVAIYPMKWDKTTLYTTRNPDPTTSSLFVPTEVTYDDAQSHFICFRRGPVMLALDERLGADPKGTFQPVVNTDGTVSCQKNPTEYPQITPKLSLLCPAENGSFPLIDFSSAGKDWESRIAVWLPTP